MFGQTVATVRTVAIAVLKSGDVSLEVVKWLRCSLCLGEEQWKRGLVLVFLRLCSNFFAHGPRIVCITSVVATVVATVATFRSYRKVRLE